MHKNCSMMKTTRNGSGSVVDHRCALQIFKNAWRATVDEESRWTNVPDPARLVSLESTCSLALSLHRVQEGYEGDTRPLPMDTKVLECCWCKTEVSRVYTCPVFVPSSTRTPWGGCCVPGLQMPSLSCFRASAEARHFVVETLP